MRTSTAYRGNVKPGLALLLAGCLASALPMANSEEPRNKTEKPKVTVYCSVDQSIAQIVLDQYRLIKVTDVEVVFDSEAGKTTGLINKIIEEAQSGRTRCDVLWNSEVFNTIRLARMGLLEPYASPVGADLPERYKDAKHHWHGTSARARVLAFDKTKYKNSEVTRKWADLATLSQKPTAIANPLFGTTRGHIAALFALWGKDQGREFLTKLRDNGVQVVLSNSAAVRWVGTGKVDFAFTDSDDCKLAYLRGMRNVDFVVPDLGDGGGLMIPCSTAIIKGAPHLAEARKLVDFLLSEEVEVMLYESPAAHWPVREATRTKLGVSWPLETKLSFDKITDAMDESDTAVREILIK